MARVTHEEAPEAHTMEPTLTAVFSVRSPYRLRRRAPGCEHAGRTLAEARDNLREAVEMVLDAALWLASRPARAR
jgi:hypothetical protein